MITDDSLMDGTQVKFFYLLHMYFILGFPQLFFLILFFSLLKGGLYMYYICILYTCDHYKGMGNCLWFAICWEYTLKLVDYIFMKIKSSLIILDKKL